MAADVSLRLCGILAESHVVNAGGPLPRGRIAASLGSAAALAATLGYDYVAEADIAIAEPPWTVNLSVVEARLGEPAGAFTGRFDPGDSAAIANWMYHRICDCLAVRV